MNSRERLLTAIRCGMPDRVPVSTYELVGHNRAAWENNDASYARLMDAIRARTDCVCMWNPDCDAKLFESAHPAEIRTEQWREGDVTVCRTSAQTPRGPLTRTTRVVDGVHTVWQTEHWCKSTEDVDAAMSVPFEPVTYDRAGFAGIRDELGGNGIVMATVGDPLLNAADLMGFEDYTMWAMTETEHFARTVAAMHERGMENLRRMLDAGVADLYRVVGPEYATPPFLPPEMFARFIVPYVRDMTELIHARGGLVRLHCHGRIGQVLDHILATGADAIDPCEAPPDGDIALAAVKQRLAGRMCVFGNIQLKLLEHGAPAQVGAEVAACMDAAKAGGGYVLMPTAAPINTPLSPATERNYMAYIEAAERLRDY
jgi:uroporphyrinogen-III decarboxylase